MTAQVAGSQEEVIQNKAANDKEINFRKQEQMYQRMLEEEKQGRLAAEKALQEKENGKRSSVSEDDDYNSDEPYVDHRALDKKLKKWEAGIDQKIEKKAEEKARALVEQERRTSYLKQNSDFNDVMQQENMQRFVDKHPGLAEGILGMPEGFERQKLVYENIKALGLHKKEEPKQSIQDTIDKNKRSPYYQPSGIGTSPYAGAADYSPAGQKSAYAKLQELKSRLRL